MEFHRILVATDFSPAAQHALRWAQCFARTYGATLHLLHVLAEDSMDWSGVDEMMYPSRDVRMQLEQEASESLEQLIPDPETTGIYTQHEVRDSLDVADAILDAAEQDNVDLVVTGTHGRTGLSHMLLGSVAEKVVRHAQQPVLTVGVEAPDRPSVRRILAPVDFSEPSKRALRLAKEVGATFGAELDLLFVAEERTVPGFSDTGIPTLHTLKLDPDLVEDAGRALVQLYESVGGAKREVQTFVVHGDVSEQVVGFAEKHGTDLVVLATRGLAGLNRLLIGSVTQRVVRAAPCPVLTLNVHEDEAASDATAASAKGAA